MQILDEEELGRLQNYYIGKVVTVFCNKTNRDLREEQSVDYFVGRVDHISYSGLWTTHPTTLTKNFYFIGNIVSISEEQVVEKNHPHYTKIMSEYEKHLEDKKGAQFSHRQPPPQPTVPEAKGPAWLESSKEPPKNEDPFVDVDDLSNLAKQFKERKNG